MRVGTTQRVVCWAAAAALLIGAAVAAQRTGREPENTPQESVLVAVKTKAGKAIPIYARTGDQITVTLDSNATTGFKWQLAIKPNQNVVRFAKSVYDAPSEAIPGRGGTETWTFTAAGKGSTSVTLNYARSWEKNTPPARTQSFDVAVKY